MPSGDKYHVVAVFDSGHNLIYRRFQLPSDTVARYRLAKLFANGKAYFATFTVTFAVKHYKVLVRNAGGVLVHVIVLIVFF